MEKARRFEACGLFCEGAASKRPSIDGLAVTAVTPVSIMPTVTAMAAVVAVAITGVPVATAVIHRCGNHINRRTHVVHGARLVIHRRRRVINRLRLHINRPGLVIHGLRIHRVGVGYADLGAGQHHTY